VLGSVRLSDPQPCIRLAAGPIAVVWGSARGKSEYDSGLVNRAPLNAAEEEDCAACGTQTKSLLYDSLEGAPLTRLSRYSTVSVHGHVPVSAT
jgi:hypothetical protein